jgi:hypothetical protein
MHPVNRAERDALGRYGTDDACALALPRNAKRPSSRGYEQAWIGVRHGVCDMLSVALPLAPEMQEFRAASAAVDRELSAPCRDPQEIGSER